MKSTKIKNIILSILIVIFFVIFIYSGYKIIRWKIDSNNTKKEIKDITRKVKIKEILLNPIALPTGLHCLSSASLEHLINS